MESSSAWHWGPAVLLRAWWFMYCWVRAAGSSHRSPGRVACRICALCACVRLFWCVQERSVYESLLLCANTNVCGRLRSCTRANPKLPAGCRGLFGLERLHWFDCGHAWKSFRAVKIMTGCERRSHLVYKLRWLAEEPRWLMRFGDGLMFRYLYFFSLSVFKAGRQTNFLWHQSCGFGYHVTYRKCGRMPYMHSETLWFNYLGTQVRSHPPGQVSAFFLKAAHGLLPVATTWPN